MRTTTRRRRGYSRSPPDRIQGRGQVAQGAEDHEERERGENAERGRTAGGLRDDREREKPEGVEGRRPEKKSRGIGRPAVSMQNAGRKRNGNPDKWTAHAACIGGAVLSLQACEVEGAYAFVATSCRTRSTKVSRAIGPRSPPSRRRTATRPLPASRSPPTRL